MSVKQPKRALLAKSKAEEWMCLPLQRVEQYFSPNCSYLSSRGGKYTPLARLAGELQSLAKSSEISFVWTALLFDIHQN